MLRKGVVKNAETGEIILCVEAEEGVPMGSEAGMSRENLRSTGEDWLLIILMISIPVSILFFIITVLIHFINGK